MGRSMWVCTVEGCKANPSKRNNIERHVWLQHARKWHCGDKPEPYSVVEHKHIVEPYIRRARGPDGATPSPLTPPFTPPGSPSAQVKAMKARMPGATPLTKRVDEAHDAAAASVLGMGHIKQDHAGGPIRVLTPPSMHTPQPTPQGSPLTTKGGRLVTGTKSAPGSPYARRVPRRDDALQQQINSQYYTSYLAAAQRQIAQGTGAYGLGNVYTTVPASAAATTFAPNFSAAYPGYLNQTATAYGIQQQYGQVPASTMYSPQPSSNPDAAPAPAAYASAPQSQYNNIAKDGQETGSRTATPVPSAPAQGKANTGTANVSAVAASSAPHVRFFLDPTTGQIANQAFQVPAMTQAQQQQLSAAAAGQYSGAALQQSLNVVRQPTQGSNPGTPAAGQQPNNNNNSNNNNNNNGQNGQNGTNASNGLDFLAMACDTFQLQDQSGAMRYPQGDDMWRPW